MTPEQFQRQTAIDFESEMEPPVLGDRPGAPNSPPEIQSEPPEQAESSSAQWVKILLIDVVSMVLSIPTTL